MRWAVRAASLLVKFPSLAPDPAASYDGAMKPQRPPVGRALLALGLLLAALACEARPRPETTARQFLTAWERGDHARMYALLSAAARARVSPDAFTARYTEMEAAAAVRRVTTHLGEPVDAAPGAARFRVSVQWDTARVGTFAQEITLALVPEGGGWAVDWQPDALLAGLRDGDRVAYVAEPAPRGAILDRSGAVLAAPGLERTYPEGALAAHVLGYVEPTEAGEVGAAGLEQWGETYLAGTPGGRLVLLDTAGRERAPVAARPARPGATLHLTLDAVLQRQAEALLEGHVGALVALDPRDGAVLVLASRPTFEPARLSAGEPAPPAALLSRATVATYPAASLFKVVAMGAALEAGVADPATPYRCTGLWTGLGDGSVLEDSVAGGHGTLTLADGLVRSCNIVFYELGKRLDALDPHLLPAVARAFGLGAPTGLVGTEEAPGHVPDPLAREAAGTAWRPRDAVELAIGHGGLAVTPLQIAHLFAALATDGTLRTPVLVRRVVASDGRVLRAQTSEPQGTLPLSDEHRHAIQAALRGVVADPRGTAASAFRGFAVPSAGKTGSAERAGPALDAWFVGYAPADAPEIVAVAIVEGGGAGGQVAAPLVRALLEAYLQAPR